jgi:predicted lipid carrier protein YhbT
MPEAVYSRPMAGTLNRILAAQIRDRELGFLRARTIRIQVLDAGLSFALTLSHGGFAAVPGITTCSSAGWCMIFSCS